MTLTESTEKWLEQVYAQHAQPGLRKADMLAALREAVRETQEICASVLKHDKCGCLCYDSCPKCLVRSLDIGAEVQKKEKRA